MKGPLKEVTPEEAAEVGLILRHPSWPVLRQRWIDVMEYERYDLGKTLLVPQSEVDPTYIVRRQGFWQGVRAVLDTPDLAYQMAVAAQEGSEVTSE